MKHLNEGMRPGDLEDLILPMVTIDEYESKLDDDAIVIGFYVNDRDAGDDLNRFIQKSPVQILDSEVSPAPDQHGYYIVFLELVNDRRIVDNIEAILGEVSPLSGIDAWQMRLRDSDGVMPFSKKVLSKRFAEMRADLMDDDGATEDRIVEFLTASDLDDALIEGHQLTLMGQNTKFKAEIIGIGEASDLVEVHGLTESAVSLDLSVMAESLKMTRMLGEGWLYSVVGDHAILQKTNSDVALLLRNGNFS